MSNEKSNEKLSGKVALVTGAGSGIGQASARLFARDGAKVIVSDINKTGGEETVKQIKTDGGEALFVECDVTEETAVENLVKTAVDEFGSLDCAHNNAGMALPPQAFTDISKADFEKVVALNLVAVFVCMKHEISQMLSQKDQAGAIVNTASGAALVPAPGQPHYTATKRGVLGLTTHASNEYKHTNIRVNCVLPGLVNTPMLGKWAQADEGSEEMQAVLKHVPQNRMADPEEIAEAVVWLCSPSSRWVSGDSMVIDGGMLNR